MSWVTPRIEAGHSLREQIEESLTAAIIAGEVAPHELLTVPVLAQEYDVSATPVREAMLNLARRGFVSPVRNRGFRVREVGRDELEHLVRTRRMLECPPMLEIAPTFDASTRATFDELVEAIDASAEARDFATYVRSDKAFHLGLLALLGNPVLVEVVGNLRDQTRTVGLASAITPEHFRASIDEHAELLDLLEAGDGEAAAALMHRHVGHVLGWWSGEPEDPAAPVSL
jgi:DNA-binding GntR family transcriptional regulator